MQPPEIPDEGQRDDVVRVDGDEPVAVFAVGVGVRVVGREDEAWRSSHIPAARSLEEREREKRDKWNKA